MKQKIHIKCLIDISTDKIKVIKLIRKAFGTGLKDSKDLADQFANSDTVVYESDQKYSIRELNKTCAIAGGNTLLQYSGGTYTNGFDREALLTKIKFFAGLALDNDETGLAEDLIHIYNKYDS